MQINSHLKYLLKRQLSVKILTLTFIIAYIALGAIYIHNTWRYYEHQSSVRAIELAEAAEAFIPVNLISELKANPNDSIKPEYKQLKDCLILFRERNPEVYFAYIYTLIDGKVYIMANSEPPHSQEYYPPGYEYSEALQKIKKPYLDSNSTISEPIYFRGGTWVSALVPVQDPDTGEVIAVFGVDYPAEQWGQEAKKHALQSSVIVISILLLFAAIYWILIKNKALINLSRELKASETLFRTIFEQSPHGIAIGKDKKLISNINVMFEGILGRTKEELTALSWTEITHPDDLPKDLDNFTKFKAGEIDSYSMVKRFIKPDGSYVWVNMKVANLNLSNDEEQRQNHLCMIEDITERINAEKALLESERSKSVLLSHLPGLAYRCSYDQDWTMQFLSDGCLELTGYKPESLLVDSHINPAIILKLKTPHFEVSVLDFAN